MVWIGEAVVAAVAEDWLAPLTKAISNNPVTSTDALISPVNLCLFDATRFRFAMHLSPHRQVILLDTAQYIMDRRRCKEETAAQAAPGFDQ